MNFGLSLRDQKRDNPSFDKALGVVVTNQQIAIPMPSCFTAETPSQIDAMISTDSAVTMLLLLGLTLRLAVQYSEHIIPESKYVFDKRPSIAVLSSQTPSTL